MSYDYGAAVDRPLTRESLDPDPFVQFEAWFAEAAEVVREPEAMCLSTADGEGNPDSRMVLLKGVGPEGFRFFTNYEGAMADLATRPMRFCWFQTLSSYRNRPRNGSRPLRP